MEDRKLLEQAAKAIGGHLFIGNVSTGGLAYWLEFDDDLATARVWNPLEDDGDSFRLMVDCGIAVLPSSNNTACAIPGTDDYIWTDAPRDRAAIRRAIVRVAAAMAGGES